MNNKIEDIFLTCNRVEYNYSQIKHFREDNESLLKKLKELANDEDIKKIICDNLHIEDNGEPRELESKTTFSSTNGESGESIYKHPNPDASFNPELDEFEISGIEANEDVTKFRIKVECIRRRKFLLYDMWEPDYYWTNWINF